MESKNIILEGHNDICFIKVRFDVGMQFDEGTYGAIDYKTGNPEGESSGLYTRQLHSHAYALENPAPGALNLSPVTTQGLLYFHPQAISQSSIDWLSFDAEIKLTKIERDNEAFIDFIEEVISILQSPIPPEPSTDCPWCDYVKKMNLS